MRVDTKHIFVSIIMSVFNEAEEWIEKSISSILRQSHQNFEFIIVNDNPDSLKNRELLEYFARKDSRICLITNKKNIGLASSLNRAILNSKGKYLVRMDADDISLKNRVSEQIKFMEIHTNVGVAGTYFMLIGDKPWYSKLIIRRGEQAFHAASAQLLFSPCVLHPTVIIRSTVLKENNILYNEDFYRAQDYELWSRLINLTEIVNIPKVLFLWRISDSQSSVKDRNSQITYSLSIHSRLFELLAGRQPSQYEIEVYKQIISNGNLTDIELYTIENYFTMLLNFSISSNLFMTNYLFKELSKHWANLCFSSSLGLNGIKLYFNSQFGTLKSVRIQHLLYLLKSKS